MTWLDLTENPQAISSLFQKTPSLSNIEIMSIKIDRDGPTLELTVALSEYPASPPARWLHANTAVLTVQLVGLESIHMEGWAVENRATITVSKLDGHLEVLAQGSNLDLRCKCEWLRIAGVSAYLREATSD